MYVIIHHNSDNWPNFPDVWFSYPNIFMWGHLNVRLLYNISFSIQHLFASFCILFWILECTYVVQSMYILPGTFYIKKTLTLKEGPWFICLIYWVYIHSKNSFWLLGKQFLMLYQSRNIYVFIRHIYEPFLIKARNFWK